jgi:hypothetical protein
VRTPTTLDAERAPRRSSQTVAAVSGRLVRLSLAVALAPFAVLTVLFVGGEPI